MGYYIGLISGTSMDGIDAALVAIDGPTTTRLLAYAETPYPASLGAELHALVTRQTADLRAIGRLHAAVGHAFVAAALALLREAGIAPAAVRAIGSHGQTLAHGADSTPPFSLQIGDPNVIAWRTGITTVADFRGMDLAAGGQGAPLVPAFHAAYFRPRLSGDVAIVNLGGIANATLLPADPARPIVAFDTGPANTLLDLWCRRHTGAPFDADGRWAASGAVDAVLLSRLLADPYFARTGPKSTGREYFHLDWLDTRLAALPGPPPAPVDVQATLLALTAETVARAVRSTLPACARAALCGGGSRNVTLVRAIERALGNVPVGLTDDYGLPAAAVEAAAFAWLAERRLANAPGNVPSCTGAARAVVLGAVYRAG